ncbi:hypothetical protein [Paraburkholderia rhizosphaerae]|uniref:hypothetical protein n=1 Tax=Paraburkholderia rhizosphaerae TaxID=480658 RepID=UPI00141709DC|nr:hypothetical protein [Paraburkholderia rhizosphaerae]
MNIELESVLVVQAQSAFVMSPSSAVSAGYWLIRGFHCPSRLLKYGVADARHTFSTSRGAGAVDIDLMPDDLNSGGIDVISSLVFIFMPLSPRAFACG